MTVLDAVVIFGLGGTALLVALLVCVDIATLGGVGRWMERRRWTVDPKPEKKR